MSCGNPSADDDALMPRRFKFDKSRDCVKCKLKPGNIVIRHAVYCKECFIPHVTLKFRRALEPFVNANAGTSKRPKLKAAGSLVLGFSGGLGSSILVDIVHKTYFANQPPTDESGEPRGGANHPRNANVWPSCAVCYVEVCSALPETRDRTEEIRQVLAPYPRFQFIPLRIEDAFDDTWWSQVAPAEDRSRVALELGKDGLYTEGLAIASLSISLSPVDALRSYLTSLPTQTAVSNAIRVLIRLLLLYTARSREASHLLLGTSLTTLSVSLISCISQGGGYAILEEQQEEWNPETAPVKDRPRHGIRVVRPLRDVTLKECATFAWWNRIPVVGREKQARAVAGIAGLTKDFIVGLERDYPSTVSTIARTCAKLEPKSVSQGSCILCDRPLQEGLEDWKDRISIRSYSDPKIATDLVHFPLPTSTDPSITSNPSVHPPSITKCLCYSCQTMLTSRSSRGPKLARIPHGDEGTSSAALPTWVTADLVDSHMLVSDNGEVWRRKRGDEAEKRRAVAEFLLDQ
ncbi:hypothetical protein F5I97DRAFT_1888710 [Phlebopus sp. FC_14]|nr:hypothetical protein F5I97DRAFT_1888710 [Phlebopus sp. FC_14]